MRFGAFIADYETSWLRAACALAVMAVAPPILLSLVFTIMSPEEPSAQGMAVGIALFFYLSFMVLILLGWPVWMLMHVFRLRGWGAAILGGAAVAATLVVLKAYGFDDGAKSHPLRDQLLAYFPIFIPVGALVGLLIWAVAYRCPAPQTSADTAR